MSVILAFIVLLTTRGTGGGIKTSFVTFFVILTAAGGSGSGAVNIMV